MEVPTRILDEDTYPVGGFTSLSTRGTVESLLHSQLAFMEDSTERPDLFDIKYVRDELLYYARDENQFLRRRRTFVFALWPDLVASRFKDSDLPYQRGVLLLALLVVIVRKLEKWLSTDALQFQVVFVATGDTEPLAAERALLQTLLREQIATSTVHVRRLPAAQLAGQCSAWSRRSLCHCLNVAVKVPPLEAEETVVTQFQVNGPRPALGDPLNELAVIDSEDPVESWGQALEQVLRRWV
jgi:hypothetical protein